MNNKKKYNILIYGCGNIGYRHLQAILKLKFFINIYLFDINTKKYNLYKKELTKEKFNINSKSIHYLKNIKENHFDLFICSSTAKNRYDQIKNVISNNLVENIIIEKIPFQNPYDYKKANQLFKNKKIKVWINCPNRTYKSYNNLKNLLKNEKINMKVSGSSWNILSNSIHYLDIFNYLNKSKIIQIKNNLEKPTKSKRNGFKEAYGNIDISFSNKNYLQLESFKKKNIPIKIEFFSKSIYFCVFEQFEIIYYTDVKNKKKYSLKKFEIEYQSNLTNKIYYNIIVNQSCDLVKFSSSLNYLVPFFRNLKKYFKKYNYDNIPIT